MDRRPSPLLQVKNILILALVALIAGVGSLFITFAPSRSYRGLAAFPTDTYLEGGNLFSQEDFLLSGRLDNVLIRSANGKRFLVSIRPKDSDFLLPVIVEPSRKTLQRAQDLMMKVHVSPNGSIVCSDYEIR